MMLGTRRAMAGVTVVMTASLVTGGCSSAKSTPAAHLPESAAV